MCRYKEHLRALFVVHPSWWLKVFQPLAILHIANHCDLYFQLSGWWFLTFTASEIKDKVQYLTGVQYLYDTINPDQLDIPQFIFEHDKAVSVACILGDHPGLCSKTMILCTCV